MTNVLFLCDGHVPKCQNSFGCYINGGECKHTSDFSHRIPELGLTSRFEIDDGGDYGVYLMEVQDE